MPEWCEIYDFLLLIFKLRNTDYNINTKMLCISISKQQQKLVNTV